MAASDKLSAAQFHRINSLASELSSKGIAAADVTEEHAGQFPVDVVRRSMAVIEQVKAKHSADPFAGL